MAESWNVTTIDRDEGEARVVVKMSAGSVLRMRFPPYDVMTPRHDATVDCNC